MNDITALLSVDHLGHYCERLRSLEHETDLVVLAHPYTFNAVRHATPNLPWVYDAHNIEATMKADLLPPSRVRTRLLDAVKTAEHAAIRGAEVTVAVSDDDETYIRSVDAAADVVQIPNGADVSGTRFISGEQRRTNSLLLRTRLRPDLELEAVALFVASWHPPNIEAARAVVELAEALPEVLFVLAGGHTNAIRGDVPPNVLRLGMISELTKIGLLQGADVALNPMTSGGGSNLKLVEYLASGTPVVSTPLGCRGFHLVDGEHLSIAAVSEFGAAIRRVLRDTDLSERIAVAGRAIVEQRYDWQQLAATFATTVGAKISR